jgi:hypothetical protein
VQGRLATGAIEGAAQDLAVNRHDALNRIGELAMNWWKAAPNRSGSSSRNSRLKVSWLGRPFSSLRKRRRKVSFASANRSMATAL